VPPCKVLIIGAGVAGLAALGAAKGLGAIVRAFDVRASVADQIKSLGGEFLTVSIQESGDGLGGYAKEMSKEFIDAEYALFRAQAREVDIVITTALIPEQGGNCEVTVPGEAITHHDVTVLGYTDLASRMAHVSSDLYGTNLWHMLEEMGGATGWKIDLDNDAVRPALVLQAGDKKWPAPPMPQKAAPAPVAAKPAEAPKPLTVGLPTPKSSHGPAHKAPSKAQGVVLSVIGLVLAAVWLSLRYGSYGKSSVVTSPDTFVLVQHITVFVMAVFVGFQVVWNVTPALHTPLMSVTNAISGIIVVGGLLGGRGALSTSVGVAVVATLFATINIAGGFIVTRRMLAMFRK
jgi:NAD(P) transhydrogenase subunit alpha